jgi:anti-sigma regulatory factor (Ser/Thr protein kinase)
VTIMTTGPGRQPAAAGHLRPHPPDTGPRWPHSSSLTLGAFPEAVPCARLHTRQILSEWGLAEIAGDAERVVSELVTNSIEVTRARDLLTPVRFTLLTDRRKVLVVVWDGCPDPPVMGSVTMDCDDICALEECGRGLIIVDALATQWDWKLAPAEQGGGKVIRALLSRPEILTPAPPRPSATLLHRVRRADAGTRIRNPPFRLPHGRRS